MIAQGPVTAHLQQFQGDCPDFDRVVLLDFCLSLIALDLPQLHTTRATTHMSRARKSI
jgi:hypothetical protein